MGSRYDQLVDFVCLEMFQETRNIIVNAVPTEVLSLDQFFKIRQTAKVHAKLDARIESRQPPCLCRSHGQTKSAKPLRVDFGPAGEVSDGLKLVEHHPAPENLSFPEHELEGVPLAGPAVFLVLAAGKAPAINGQRDQSFSRTHRGVSRQDFPAYNQLLF